MYPYSWGTTGYIIITIGVITTKFLLRPKYLVRRVSERSEFLDKIIALFKLNHHAIIGDFIGQQQLSVVACNDIGFPFSRASFGKSGILV